MRRALILTVFALAMNGATASTAPEASYTVFVGRVARGEMVLATEGERSSIRFGYSDRGRGPSLEERVELDSSGLPTSIVTSGHNEVRSPVDESFSRSGGRARWRSAADEGSAVAERAFYVPQARTPHDTALLAQALLRSPTGTLDVLPAGRARLIEAGSRQFTRGSEHVRARLFGVDGLGFAPLPVWLDEHGRLFAEGSENVFAIRRGWEDLVPELRTIQDELLAAPFRTRLRQLGIRRGPVVFRNVTLFDSEARRMRRGMSVVVDGDRIHQVGRTARVRIPSGALIVDGTGKTLLPGLFDMHAHYGSNPLGGPDQQAALHLASGVTSVRNMAGSVELIERVRARIASAEMVGPRVFPAGVVEGEGATAGPTRMIARTAAEMNRIIATYAELGYRHLKIYSLVPPALVPGAIQAAHRRGMWVSGHVPNGMTAREAAGAGLNEINHIFYVLSDLVPLAPDGPSRAAYVMQAGGDVDLGSREARELISFLARRNTVVDPTLSLYWSQLTGRPASIAPTFASVAERLPLLARRELSGVGRAQTDAERNAFARTYGRMSGLVFALHRRGVRIAPGSDWIEGFTLISELELYSAAGIPNLEVLYLATLGAARILSVDHELGAIRPGYRADLIMLHSNPADRIEALRDVALVMAEGVMFDPVQLHQSVNVRRPADQ